MVSLPAYANNFLIDSFEDGGGIGNMMCDISLVNNPGGTAPPTDPQDLPVPGDGNPAVGANQNLNMVIDMIRQCSIFLDTVSPPSEGEIIIAQGLGGMFRHMAGTQVKTTVMLWWDGNFGADGNGNRQLNENFANSVNLRITYSFSDNNVNGMATLFDGDGDSASVPFTLVAGTITTTVINIPLANFVAQNANLNLADIDEIKLTFETTAGGSDYALDLIDINMQTAPPDPSPIPTTCVGGNIVHIDKIIFQPTQFIIHPTFLALNPALVYDIKVTDDPNAVKYLNNEVADFLNFLGYTLGGGAAVKPNRVTVIDVEYSTICVP